MNFKLVIVISCIPVAWLLWSFIQRKLDIWEDGRHDLASRKEELPDGYTKNTRNL